MAHYDKKNMMRLVHSFNLQCKNSIVPSFKRSAFSYIEKVYINDYSRPVIIDGGHCIGKTTLLRQTARALLDKGISDKNIIYISFDYPLSRGRSVEEFINIYRSEANITDEFYVLIDNAEYAEGFADFCKNVNNETKVIAATSAHIPGLDINCEHVRYIPVSTMTFFEYCEYCGYRPKHYDSLIYPAELHLKSNTDTERMYKSLYPLYPYFEEYIKSGGYFGNHDFDFNERVYSDVIEKTLIRDIPLLFEARKVTDIEKVFVYLCYLSSETVSVNSISKALRISRATVEKYIEYFERTNLITIHEPIDWENLNSVKGYKKVYINNHRIRIVSLNLFDIGDSEFNNSLKNDVKIAFLSHCNQFFRDGTAFGFFKKHPSSDRTDILIHFPDKINALVNVQYEDKAQLRANDHLITYANTVYPNYLITKKPEDYGIVRLDDGRSVCKIPAFAALYLFGYYEKYNPMIKGEVDYDLYHL